MVKTKNKFESHIKVCENKDFCSVAVPSEDKKILEFNQYWKHDEVPYIIYAGLGFLIKKVDGCKNNRYESQKWVSNFSAYIQCLQPRHLMVLKIIMMYTEVKVALKSLVDP